MSRTVIRDELLRIEEGEAWGVLEGIKWAVELGIHNLIIETKCSNGQGCILRGFAD